MKRFLRVASAAVIAAMTVAVVAAQGTKLARGTVVKTDPGAMSVKVGDREMTFAVDGNTTYIARGGSTAMRQVRAEGKSGLPYTDVVKVGQTIEVEYHEQGLHATRVRVLTGTPVQPGSTAKAAGKPMAPPPPPPPQAMTTSGLVETVSDTALSIKATTGATMFAIDGKTKVFGPGLGTQSRSMQRAGEKTVFSSFVHKGDTVRVTFSEEGGTKHASEVHVIRKGTT